jgi:hypothetical protein
MKKTILTLTLLITVNLIFGQWKTELIDNQLDPPFKVAKCDEQDGNTTLCIVNNKSELCLVLFQKKFCDIWWIDVAFVVKGVSKKYILHTFHTEEFYPPTGKNRVILDQDILIYSESEQFHYSTYEGHPEYNLCEPNFLSDFKNATKMVIRVNEKPGNSPCSSSIHNFIMTGSTNAINFVIGKQ